jgi:hypothetical protein
MPPRPVELERVYGVTRRLRPGVATFNMLVRAHDEQRRRSDRMFKQPLTWKALRARGLCDT